MHKQNKSYDIVLNVEDKIDVESSLRKKTDKMKLMKEDLLADFQINVHTLTLRKIC